MYFSVSIDCLTVELCSLNREEGLDGFPVGFVLCLDAFFLCCQGRLCLEGQDQYFKVDIKPSHYEPFIAFTATLANL